MASVEDLNQQALESFWKHDSIGICENGDSVKDATISSQNAAPRVSKSRVIHLTKFSFKSNPGNMGHNNTPRSKGVGKLLADKSLEENLISQAFPMASNSSRRSQIFCPVYRRCKKQALLRNLLRATRKFDDTDEDDEVCTMLERKERKADTTNERDAFEDKIRPPRDKDRVARHAAPGLTELQRKYGETLDKVKAPDLRDLLEPVKEMVVRLRQLIELQGNEESANRCTCCSCESGQERKTAAGRSEECLTRDCRCSTVGTSEAEALASLENDDYVQVQDVATQFIPFSFDGSPSKHISSISSSVHSAKVDFAVQEEGTAECYECNEMPAYRRCRKFTDKYIEKLKNAKDITLEEVKASESTGSLQSRDDVSSGTDLNDRRSIGTSIKEDIIQESTRAQVSMDERSSVTFCQCEEDPTDGSTRATSEEELCPCGCGYFVDGVEDVCTCTSLNLVDLSKNRANEKSTCKYDCETDYEMCICEIREDNSKTADGKIVEKGSDSRMTSYTREIHDEIEFTSETKKFVEGMEKTERLGRDNSAKIDERTRSNGNTEELQRKFQFVKRENEYLENLIKTCPCSMENVKKIPKEPPIRTTYSGLSTAADMLRAKCRRKDGMIAALADGLCESKRIEQVVKHLVAPCLAFLHWDFDENGLYTYLHETLSTSLNGRRKGDFDSKPTFISNVPAPTNFRIIREICQCALLTWRTPKNVENVAGYQILVDGEVVNYVRSPTRTETIIGLENTTQPVEITLHAIGKNGELSDPVTLMYPSNDCPCVDED